MIGPEGAAQAVAERLAAALPGRLAELRTRYTVTAAELPDPALVEPHDRIRRPLEDWPAVLVLVQQLARFTPTDRPSAGGETWVARYPFRVYLWLRAEDDVDVDLLRKRYVLAVREVLLARRSLMDTAGPAGDVPNVDPLALTEDYGPVALDENGNTIAAAYVAADILIAEEVTPLPELGTVNTTTVTVEHLDPPAEPPPHPAL